MKFDIRSFAEAQKEIHRYLVSRSDVVIEHLIKIFLYTERQEVSHWKQEVAAALNRIYKFKNIDRYPSKGWIMTNSWNVLEYTVYDYIYPIIEDYGELTSNLTVTSIYDKIHKYFDWLSTELSIRGRVSNTRIYNKIDELMKTI